jgi:hypothetical protein
MATRQLAGGGERKFWDKANRGRKLVLRQLFAAELQDSSFS